MQFIEISHPEGDVKAINVDRITSVYYRAAGDNGDKGGKASMNNDLAGTENDVLLYGEEAERVWAILKGLEAK